MSSHNSSPTGNDTSGSSPTGNDSYTRLPISPRIREAIRLISRRALLGNQHKSIRAAIREELTSPERALPRERLAFVLGVAALLVTQHVLLMHPRSFGFYYTVLAVPLIIYRCKQYVHRKWGSFLLDFCYLVNVLLLVHLWILPFNPYFFEIVFASANGPVAWAIILWRNSLVFHSPERLTSLFIHIFPPLVTYCQRWLVYNSSTLLPSYLSCVDPVAARTARETLLASYKAAVEAAAEATANSFANITMSDELSMSSQIKEESSISSSSSPSSFMMLIMQMFGFSNDCVHPPSSPESAISSPSPFLNTTSLDVSEAIESAEAALGSVSGINIIEIPYFGEIPISEFEKNVYPEDIAGSLFTTCDRSYWRVLGVPLICYLLWQVSYFILTEMPLPISFMRRFCKVEVDDDEEEDEKDNGTEPESSGEEESDSNDNSESSGESSSFSSESSSEEATNACHRRSRKHYSNRRRNINTDAAIRQAKSSSRSLFSDPTQLSSLRWMVNKARTGGLTQMSLKFARFLGILKKNEEFDAESKRTKFVFALIQLMITIAGLACSKIMYDSKIAHTLFLIMLILVAAYNGASFTLRNVDIAAAEKGQAPVSQETRTETKIVKSDTTAAGAAAAATDATSAATTTVSGGGVGAARSPSDSLSKKALSPSAAASIFNPVIQGEQSQRQDQSAPSSFLASPPSSIFSPSLRADLLYNSSPSSEGAHVRSNGVGSDSLSGVNLSLSELGHIEEKERGRSSEVQNIIKIAQVYTSASEARQRVIEESKNWTWMERRRFFVNKKTGEQSKIFPSGVDKRFISIERER